MSQLEPRRTSGREPLTAADIPGLARVVAVSSFRIGAWAAATSVRTSRRLVGVALHPTQAIDLAEDVRATAEAVAQALIGDQIKGVRSAAASNPVIRVVTGTFETVAPRHVVESNPEVNALHEAGRELLRRSRDVWSDDRGHPAYARIIEELAPDEGRILVLLLKKGPQATVDVRTGGLIGTVSSDLVASGLNMIGAQAGCRYVDRVPSFLHNLERLGLIWFSAEAVRDPMEYQVLEAQPDVIEAMRSVRRAKSVRRSVQLTPFGEDFCRDGLGLHLTQDELTDVPRHGLPNPE